jgi:hypothetical protein
MATLSSTSASDTMRLSGKRQKLVGYMIGLVGAFAIFEGGLQLIEATPTWRALPVIEPILGQPDYDIGYSFTPGTEGTWVRENRARIRINSLGLRDFEISPQKPPGTFRIALTGDSMVEALQVEQERTFDNIAERRLAQSGRPVEIANLAMSGNGPLRQLVRLEHFGYPLDPDLAILYSSASDFLTGELLRDDQNPGYVATSHGSLERGYGFRSRWQVRNVDTFLGRSFIAMLQHFAVMRMIYLRSRDPWRRVLGLPAEKPAKGSRADPCATSSLETLDSLWSGERPVHHARATRRFLDDLAQSTAAARIPVIYLMADIPIPEASCGRSIELRRRVVDAMSNAFVSRGMKFVDWNAAVLEATGQTAPAVLSGLRGFDKTVPGGHLNYRGHEVFAAALTDVVRRDVAGAQAVERMR